MNEDIGRVAKWDQMEAALPEIAKLVAGYYCTLIQQGVDREYAFVLTYDYQDALLKPSWTLDSGSALLQSKQSTYMPLVLLIGAGLIIVNILGMVGALPR